MAACQAGDKEAYADLVKRGAPQVFATCLGLMVRVQDAEDAAQEALLRGFASIRQLRAGQRFRPWIVRTARNLCTDLLRRKTTERQALSDRARQPQAGTGSDPALQAALSRLPEKYRLPLVLYYLDGQKTENIAISLNLSPAGVATRLSRARKKLRALLSEQEGEP